MVPATVRAGSVVDVWVTPDAARAPRAARSTLVLDDVTVVAAPAPGTCKARHKPGPHRVLDIYQHDRNRHCCSHRRNAPGGGICNDDIWLQRDEFGS